MEGRTLQSGRQLVLLPPGLRIETTETVLSEGGKDGPRSESEGERWERVVSGMRSLSTWFRIPECYCVSHRGSCQDSVVSVSRSTNVLYTLHRGDLSTPVPVPTGPGFRPSEAMSLERN